MKIIQNSLYDMWLETTDELLRIKKLKKEEYKEEGRTAWGLINKCAQKLEDTEMSVAFWETWGSCNVTYEMVAAQITQNRKLLPPDKKADRRIKETATADTIKALLDHARDKIQKWLDSELDLLELQERRHDRKSRRT